MKIAIKNNRKKFLIIGFAVLVVVLTAIIMVNALRSSEEKSINASTPENQVEEKTVKALVEESKTSDLILAGKVTANNTNKLKIDPDKGTVKEVLVKEGDKVEKGQALFTYQTDQQMKTKEAELDAEAKARAVEVSRSSANIKWETYNKKVAQLNQAKADNDKENKEELKAEIKTLEGEVDQAYTDGLTGDNEVKNAESELEKAQLMQANEQERLGADTIVADNAGTIKSLNMDLINQSKEKQREESFMEIIDDSSLFVNGDINEFDREKVSLNQPVELIDRKNKEKKWKGKIVQVANLSSEESGSEKKQDEDPNLSKFPYKVLIENGDKMPIIGSHVYVKVLPKEFEEGKIILNRKYVITKDNKQFVWKVDDKKIKFHEIKGTPAGENLVTINEGLTQNDKIAVPKEGMKDGMEVGEDVKP
jgi:HlyD family secretion protein